MTAVVAGGDTPTDKEAHLELPDTAVHDLFNADQEQAFRCVPWGFGSFPFVAAWVDRVSHQL